MIEIAVPFLETIEPFVEILNGIMAIIIAVMGISVLTMLDKDLKKAWKYFLIAILLFSAHEAIGILRGFEIVTISGLYDLTELIFITAFLASVYVFQKLFRQLSLKVKR